MSKDEKAPSHNEVRAAYIKAVTGAAHVIGIEGAPELQRDIAETLADSLGGHSAEEQVPKKP